MNERRPYEKYLTDMNTAKWKLIQPELIEIGLLIPTQSHICEYTEEETSYCKDYYVHVVLFEGKLFLQDGHNRVVKEIKRGNTMIVARVKRLSYSAESVMHYAFEVKPKPNESNDCKAFNSDHNIPKASKERTSETY